MSFPSRLPYRAGIRTTEHVEQLHTVAALGNLQRDEVPSAVHGAARCRWVLTVLYLGGLRASELTATTMGAFLCVGAMPKASSAGGWK